jgi:tetratricopeptide (TPR) repeat protein
MAVRKVMPGLDLLNGVDPVKDRTAIALMQLGIRHRDDGRLQDAIDTFRRSRELQPKLGTSWNNEAQVLWLQGRFDEAVQRQEEGLALSGDANSFGWAQLAEMHHFLGRNDERDRCTARAADIPPVSADSAVKVCLALACAARHGDICAFAKRSGFLDDARLACLAGIAAANLGRKKEARALFETSVSAKTHYQPVTAPFSDLLHGTRDSVTPFGTWPYFTLETYDAHPLAAQAMALRRPEDENVVCDVLAILLSDHAIAKRDALEALEPFRGTGAEALRKALGKTKDFDETDEDSFDRRETSGGMIAVSKMMADFGYDTVTLSREVPASWNLPDPKEQAAYEEILRKTERAKPGTEKWNKARDAVKAVLDRHPDFFRAQFNYAAMLEREDRMDEARAILDEVVSAHPDYAFARAARLRLALRDGDMALAARLAADYRPPARMHAQEYLAWLRVLLLYYGKTGEKEKAENTADAIERIEEEFGL